MIRMITYRPPRIALALLAGTIILWRLSPPDTVLYISYKLIATIFIICGFILMITAWFQFKRSNVAICPTAETQRIITEGAYKYSRNPMYLGILLMLLGASFGMGTITAMLAPTLFFLIMDKIFIPYEEEKLHFSFGDEYGHYERATRRWL